MLTAMKEDMKRQQQRLVCPYHMLLCHLPMALPGTALCMRLTYEPTSAYTLLWHYAIRL